MKKKLSRTQLILTFVYDSLLTCFSFPAPVKAMRFDSSSGFLITIGGKHTHVFHNVTGYRVIVENLKENKTKASSAALRDRLQQQADQARYTFLHFSSLSD